MQKKLFQTLLIAAILCPSVVLAEKQTVTKQVTNPAPRKAEGCCDACMPKCDWMCTGTMCT